MRILLDTHILLWAAKGTLPPNVQSLLDDHGNDLYFSPINLWEIELKRSKLKIDANVLYQNLVHNGYRELPVSARHVLSLSRLPDLHNDLFDRMLLAQALSEQVYLLTSDSLLAQYNDQVEYVLFYK